MNEREKREKSAAKKIRGSEVNISVYSAIRTVKQTWKIGRCPLSYLVIFIKAVIHKSSYY